MTARPGGWCGGTPGGKSLSRARTELSFIIRVPLAPKRKPRAAVSWAYRYAFPRLRSANLTANQSGSTWRDRGGKVATPSNLGT